MVCNPTVTSCGSCNSSSPCYTATLGCMGCQKLLVSSCKMLMSCFAPNCSHKITDALEVMYGT